jgi:pyrroline-5-carboxylate reductase
MQSLGILGVGELSESVVRGLRRSGFKGEINISPRNAVRADTLAREYGCKVLRDNQAVVDRVDLVLLGVRPEAIDEVATQVRLRPDQALLSLAAGISLEQLRSAFPQVRCTRLMLSCSAKINSTMVVICPPDQTSESLFGVLGDVVVLEDEHSFELATVAACMNGWFYYLLDDLAQWLSDKGLDTSKARALVLGNLKDCLTTAESSPDQSLKSLGQAIATPGTFTAEGLAVLMHQPLSATWGAASEVVLDALLTRSRL